MTESTRGATADPRSMCIPAEWTDGALSEAEKPLTGEPDMEEVQFDIPEDAYGAGILAIVRDLQVIRAGPWSSEDVQVKVVQASFALLLLSMNLLMQLGLLYFINLFVVGPSVHKIQSQYLHFHERVFDSDGNFLREEWEDYDGKEDLCQIGMSSPLFYFTVVFLWVLLIVRELRTTERLARDIWSMPSCRTSAAMTGEDSDHHVVQVVALTPCVRTLIYFMVILPKMVICCTLMYLGCQWLTATNSFADLVMNSIAMEFVTGVDEALYETLLPVAHRKQVADINFVTYRPRAGGRSKEFAAFKRSFIYLLLSTLLVIFYKWLGQTVLPENISDLKEACQDLNAQKRVSLCTSPFWRGSTGLNSCFPYGH
mmetsp:Transcript_48103/g.99396  ORF Transcript_48103/g.99396 Transcript_48103/m.99396 type:complete len:370 (+) Transcript_48103:115-1224(+)